MEEIVCPVCGVAQWPSDDCNACGHPLDPDREPEAVEVDEVAVEGFGEDELDDVPVEDDEGAGDGPFEA